MTDSENVAAEEMSSGSDDHAAMTARTRKLPALSLLVVVLLAIVVTDVRLIVSRHRSAARQHALDRVLLTTQFGGLETSRHGSGHATVDEAEVLIRNSGRYAVTVEDLAVQLPGITVVGWRVPDRSIGVGQTTAMQVLIRATCATSVSSSSAGRLTLAVTSAAGRLHNVTSPLTATAGFVNPFVSDVRQTCGL